MTRIFKYLKPFAIGLVACALLLFVQAMMELNLPNFMSDIVNVGLQQGGVEHATPEAISQDGYEFITTMMSEDEVEAVHDHYQLVSVEQATDKEKKQYPLLVSEPVYVLQDVDKATYEALDPIFSGATWTFINLAQDMGGSQSSSADGNVENVNMRDLYAVTPMLKQLPAQTIQAARDKAEAMDEAMTSQTATVFVKGFYEDLGMDAEALQRNYILKIGLMMIGLSLIGVAAAIAVGFLSSRIAAGLSKYLRSLIFKKVQTFSHSEFNRFSVASLITRSTNDITQLQTFIVMGIRMICYAPIMGIGGIIMALRTTDNMGWIIALAVIILLGLIAVIFSAVMPRFKVIQKLVDRLNLVMRENLNGMAVVRAFGNQKFEQERFTVENENVTKNNLFVNRSMTVMMPFMMLIMNGVNLLILWVGAHHIAESNMQVGDMMAFMQYAMQIIMSFLMISMMFILVPRSSVSAERIADVLEVDPVIKDPAKPVALPPTGDGRLIFDDVSFRYEGADADVLHDISFTAEPGQVTAFIGPTGSGKSTLVNLIPRFYDVSDGKITFDGVDIRDLTLHDLREQIGYVPQKAVLFSGTIDTNLKYGRPEAPEEDVMKAADIAQATEFITADGDGFERHIAQGGGNVSGGQKQRLSIARALVKKPGVYVFDDSFSALDFKTDAKLRAGLKPYTRDAAVLIVAQRINTIMHADQIIVLDKGEIVGRGTHEELLKNCPTYIDIAESQLGKEAV